MIFLGVGSNLGNKVENLEEAYAQLGMAGVHIVRKSSFYQSRAWGIKEQDSFVNAVIEVAFEGSPFELLDLCLKIERRMGRKRVLKWGPRLIDIDIIEFEEEILETSDLVIPHPFYVQRGFVLVPFAELEPDWIVSHTGKSLQHYLQQIPTDEWVIRLENE